MFHKIVFLVCLLFITSCAWNDWSEFDDTGHNSALLQDAVEYSWEEFSKKEEAIEATTMEKNTFSIVFASAMDRKSVEEKVVIFPDTEKTIAWEDDKNMEVHLNNIPDWSDEVSVNIASSSKTLSWVDLGKTITKKFLVEKSLEIDFISPEWAITDLTKNITVRFNQPVVNLTSLDEQWNCPVVIEPQLEWKCVWITTSTVQFRPESGFPIWAKYSVVIPKWFKWVNWDESLLEKKIEIITPEFSILNVDKELSNKESFNIVFNAPVLLDDIKKYISVEKRNEETWKSDALTEWDFTINYFVEKDSLWKEVEKKNHLQLELKSKEWGYDNNYIFSVDKWLTWVRGNIGLKVAAEYPRTVKSILSSYWETMVKLLDEDNISVEIVALKWKNIITQDSPILVFNFEEDVSKISDIFEITSLWKKIKFEEYVPESYLKQVDAQLSRYREETWLKEWEKYSDRIKFIKINENFWEDQEITVKIKASKIASSKDIVLDLSTSHKNSLVKIEFKDYKTTCLYFEKKLLLSWTVREEQLKQFEFGGYGTLTNLSTIYKNHKTCDYIEWNYWYVANTQLLPESEFDMKINSELLDENYYSLDMSYSQKVKTGVALNVDKQLSVVTSDNLNIIPEWIDNFWVVATTRHLDVLDVEVCNGKIAVVEWATDSMKDPECESREIRINNKWYEQTYTVIELQKIFGREFSEQWITVNISKLQKDIFKKTLWSYYYYGEHSFKKSFIVHSTNAFIKTNQNKQILWLYDFNSWKNIDSSKVKEIKSFTKNYDYKTKIYTYTWIENVSFTKFDTWLVELDIDWVNNRAFYLVELLSGEKILIQSAGSSDISNKMIFMSLDKPIYKPWDTVNIKGHVRTQWADWFEEFNEENASFWLEIKDSQYSSVVGEKIEITKNGSFEYSFVLEKNAKLWNYKIQGLWRSIWRFSVEEYEKPDFKVEVESDKKIYNYWETAIIDISSEYYLWSPLVWGVWKINFYESHYNFDWWKTKGYLWWENKNYYWFDYWNNLAENFQKRDSQNIILDASWKIKIDPLLEWEENKIYKVESSITDPKTKKTVSNSVEFSVVNSDIFAWMQLDKSYYSFGEKININYVSVDRNWEKLSQKPLKLTVKKVLYQANKQTGENERIEENILEKDVTTNDSWIGEFDYSIDEYGEIIIEISADWNVFSTTKTLYIYWNNIVNVTTPSHKLNISPKKDTYKIGEEAEFQIATSLVWKALITVEKQGKVFDYKLVDIDKALSKHTFEVKKEYLPNFFVSATLIQQTGITDEKVKELTEIRTKQSVYEAKIKKLLDDDISLYNHFTCTFSPFPYITDDRIPKEFLLELAQLKSEEDAILQILLPQYETGTVSVSVDKQDVVLDTKISFDKTEYLPWDKQTITLEVNDFGWNPVNWDATIVIVDEALLALKKKSGKNILDYFYSEVPNWVRNQNLLTKFVKRIDLTDGSMDLSDWVSFSNLSFWDMAMKWVSMDETVESTSVNFWNSISWWSSETAVREDFKDVAKYFGTVEVVNGKAEVLVDALPDNLTTWVVDGFVMTKNTHIGLINNSFKVSKDLNILTSLPRFFVINDELEITAVIINSSDEKLSILPELTITNAEILDSPETLELDANAQTSVTWKVKALRGDTEIDLEKLTSEIVITATSWNQSDSISIQKPIHPYSTPESSFTSGKTTDVSYEEKIILPESIDSELWNLEITMWTNVVNALFKNIDEIIPEKIWFNSYYRLETLEKLLTIKNLYSQSGDLEKFEAIKITDEDDIIYNAEEVIEKIISWFTSYMSYDWGIQYSKTCRRSPCSNFNLSIKTLNILNKLDEKYSSEELQTLKQKLVVYIKKQLETKINSKNTWVNMYIQATDFITLAQAWEKDFVTKNISSLSKVDTTIAQLDSIKLYRILNIESEKRAEIIKKLKNSMLIEARGSYLPSGKYTNDESTSKMLAELLFLWETERLTVDNMAQYLSSIHTTKNNLFWQSYIIDSLALYLEKYGNLQNIDFVWASYLDKKQLDSVVFNSSNKFDTHFKSVPFKNNFELWEEYSLGFTNTWTGNLYYNVNLNYYLPIEEIEPRDEWIIISRNYYDHDEYTQAYKKECHSWWRFYSSSTNCTYKKTQEIESISSWVSWNMIVWEIEVTIPVERTNVVIEDFIPAGAEILNTNLDVTPEVAKNITGWNNWYYGFTHIENRDEKIFMFAEKLYPGTYKYTYVLQLNHNWKYHNKPAIWYVLDKKEIWWRTRWGFFNVTDK